MARPIKKLPPLPNDTERIIEYWLRCLDDARRIEISRQNMREYGTEIAISDVLSGICPREIVDGLKKKALELERGTKSNDRGGERFASANNERLQVLIAPLRFAWSGRGDPRDFGMPALIEPYWIPADLSMSGEITPPRGRLPWIPRSFLEPLSTDSGFSVGKVAALEEFTRKNPPVDYDTWSKYWTWCDNLFQAVCGERISQYKPDYYEQRKNPVILVDVSGGAGSKEPKKLYIQVLNGMRAAGLLRSLATLREKKRRYLKQNVSSHYRGSLRHLGQFECNFALSPSQRNAVHQTLQLPSGEVLVVTGPPGTGKTTLLQSIVASLWVSAAYQQKKPPIIVACSGTNQAVTNIITAFGKANSQPGPLDGWWLPGVYSYGRYLPAKTRADEAQGLFQIERADGTGMSSEMENQAYYQQAKKDYLTRATQYAGKSLTIKSAISHFHRELKHEVFAIHRKTNFAAYGTVFEWLKTLFGFKRPISLDDFRHVIETLDGNHRHRAFQLATHYWEGRWLLEAEGIVSRLARGGNVRKQLNKGADDWMRHAMITPCFVATFATAPRFFDVVLDDNTPLIDLLIVDEASQVSAEEGAACFCLAKRAVVVGDPQQLEPVREIEEHVDIENLKTHKLLRRGDEQELKKLSDKGLTASSGSLMLLALNACRVTDGMTTGVFLAEHRRSLEGIICYCNELAYLMRLKYCRSQATYPLLFPPLGYVHVPGESELVGTSRENVLEAELIAHWLESNREAIQSTYQVQTIDDVVAVLTPFLAQKRRLEKVLRKKFPTMTIGTVHGLQGAERAIIVFSSVYDRGIRCDYFFDRGVQMLNVAVSRARDAFIVFGDMAIFNREKTELPSGILAKYLFSDLSNEITTVELPARRGISPESIVRLATLEAHRAMLQEAFETAEREILLVSPTVSRYAIEADEVCAMIRSARSRGIEVLIYVDTYLNQDEKTKEFRSIAWEGCELVKAAGAKLTFVKGIHNKTLAIDDRVLVEGSFNWLSAVRDVKKKGQKHEVSFRYTGPIAKRAIETTKEILDYLSVRETADESEAKEATG